MAARVHKLTGVFASVCVSLVTALGVSLYGQGSTGRSAISPTGTSGYEPAAEQTKTVLSAVPSPATERKAVAFETAMKETDETATEETDKPTPNPEKILIDYYKEKVINQFGLSSRVNYSKSELFENGGRVDVRYESDLARDIAREVLNSGDAYVLEWLSTFPDHLALSLTDQSYSNMSMFEKPNEILINSTLSRPEQIKQGVALIKEFIKLKNKGLTDLPYAAPPVLSFDQNGWLSQYSYYSAAPTPPDMTDSFDY